LDGRRKSVKIGVLAMQGAFVEHVKALRNLGVEAVEVKKPEELETIDGLIIPGGESTTIGKMLASFGLLAPIKEKGRKGFPIFGTCAGTVLLSREIRGGETDQPVLGLLDLVTYRNAYGRQVDSFEADLNVPVLGESPFHGIFIRAPIIESVKNGVQILCEFGGKIVAVQEGNILATSFHPELTDDPRFHQYFIEIVNHRRAACATKDK
jgi:pyridoxal 5'-phosphate synthase pdxT subunit